MEVSKEGGLIGGHSLYGAAVESVERLGLQLRWEVFNVFNRADFALPNGTLTPGINPDGTVNTGAGPAGLITQTPDVAQGNPGLGGGGPRVMQLAARLVF